MRQYGRPGTKLTKEKPRFRRGRSLSGGPGGSEVVEDAVALVGHLGILIQTGTVEDSSKIYLHKISYESQTTKRAHDMETLT